MADFLDRIKNAKKQFSKQNLSERYSFDNRYTTLQEKFKKSSVVGTEDPTWMSFGIFPNFTSADSALLLGGKGSEQVKDAYVKYDNARWYLNSIGEHKRLAALDIFQTIFWHLVVNSPWYFESIEGLDKVFSFDPSEGQAMNGGKESPITINCWESVDLRVSTMLYHYFLATTDTEHNRKVLPENLNSFTLNIYINDFRTVNNIIPNEFIGVPINKSGTVAQPYDGLSDNISDQGNFSSEAGHKIIKTETVAQNISTFSPNGFRPTTKQRVENIPLDYFRGRVGYVVTLYGCKIMKESMGEGLGTISSSEPEQHKKKIVLNYTRAEYEMVNEALLYQTIGSESEATNLDKTLSETYSERYNPAIVKDKRNLRSKIEDRVSLGLSRAQGNLDQIIRDAPVQLEKKATNNLKAAFSAYAKNTLKKFSPFTNLKKSLGNIYKDGVGQYTVAEKLGSSLLIPKINPLKDL